MLVVLFGLDTLLDQVAREYGPFDIDCGCCANQVMRFLYTLLVQVCAGEGLVIVCLYALRQLEAEYSLVVPSRLVALLVGLLSPKWDVSFME
eukprot:6564155-Heterocapsa_arctica.AAC.1